MRTRGLESSRWDYIKSPSDSDRPGYFHTKAKSYGAPSQASHQLSTCFPFSRLIQRRSKRKLG